MQTNILFFEPDGVDGALLRPAPEGTRHPRHRQPSRIRMVTHYGIEAEDIEYAADVIREVVASL